jgi:integrase
MASNRIPQLRRHKTHQRAYVSYDGGRKQKYFGQAGDWPDPRKNAPIHVRAEFDEWRQCYLAHGRTVPTEQADGLTINQVILAYHKHAEVYYQPARGITETCELDNIRYALKPLKELFGSTEATEFGAKSFKLVRQSMIDRRWTRRHINACCNKIIRMFRWATEEELLSAEVWYRLKSVKVLRDNAPGVQDKPLPEGVPEKYVKAALPFMTPPVAAMVRLQLLSGMRPGEVVRICGCDLKMSEDHKTAWNAPKKCTRRSESRNNRYLRVLGG